MGVDALETLNGVRRDVVEVLESLGLVETAQQTVVVVAWNAVVTTALNVEGGQREATTVREETIE